MDPETSKFINENVANKEKEAENLLKFALSWLDANDLNRARAFAKKSLRLHSSKEVIELLKKIKQIKRSKSKSSVKINNEAIINESKNNDDNRIININKLDELDDSKQSQSKQETSSNSDMQLSLPQTPSNTKHNDNKWVADVIERNDMLQHKNIELLKQNEILQQEIKKLKSSQNKNNINKNKNNGKCFLCHNVLEYKSKQQDKIEIRKEEIIKQNECNVLLNEHQNRLKTWMNYTISLQKEFQKYSDNENELAHDIIENDEYKNVYLLLLSYKNCMKLDQKQIERTEEVAEYFKNLNKETKKLKDIIAIYNISVPQIKDEYDELCTKYINYKQERESLQYEIEQILIKINTLIDEENITNTKKCNTLNKYYLLSKELKKYKEILLLSKELTNKYAKYENDVHCKSDQLSNYFQFKWDAHESQWCNWDISGIICWFKYLIYKKDLSLSIEIDLNQIAEKMKEQKIRGEHLNRIRKSGLRSIGFQIFDDTDQIYTKIRQLVEKYPLLLYKKDLEQTTLQIEGDQQKRIVIIPEEYKCRITKEIMIEPVVIFDNTTYEKYAIIEYVEKNNQSPTGQVYDGDGPLIFVKDKLLKSKIKEFLSIYPQFNNNKNNDNNNDIITPR